MRFCHYVLCLRIRALSAAVTPCATRRRLSQKHYGYYRGRHGALAGSALTLHLLQPSRRAGHVTHPSVYVTQVVKQVSPSQRGCTGCPSIVFVRPPSRRFYLRHSKAVHWSFRPSKSWYFEFLNVGRKAKGGLTVEETADSSTDFELRSIP